MNKQPWRVVLDGRGAHFYEQRSRGYVSDAGWDVQKIDLGIALCHFDLMQREKGLHAAFALRNPGLPLPPDTVYIASYLTE